jgi:hypothetical protein
MCMSSCDTCVLTADKQTPAEKGMILSSLQVLMEQLLLSISKVRTKKGIRSKLIRSLNVSSSREAKLTLKRNIKRDF